jgi:general secretion pathway protein L
MSTVTQSLRPWVERLRRSWRASPLPGFLVWWGGELRALLPPRWRGWFSSGADWYVLQCTGTQWSLRRAGHADVVAGWDDQALGQTPGLQASAERPRDDANVDDYVRQLMGAALQKVDRADLRLALVLPAAAVLQRTLALPLAARNDLPQVMAFELDRQTPFTAAQVYCAVRELASPAPAGRFNAELVVVRRSTLDPLLARLRTLRITIDAVDVAVADGRLGINLLPREQIPHRPHPRRRLNLALAAACGLLLALVLGQWLHNRQTALVQMQTQVEGMRGAAQRVASLRQQLQDNAGAAGFLAQRKKNTVAVLNLLQDVTQRLPDDAWLERFSVDNAGQVGLQGESTQAAKLLDALKDSPLLTDASFQGSIQPDPATGKERFYLTAQLRQAHAGKPTNAAATPAGSAP